MKKITKDMKISEILELKPESKNIFLEYGLPCFACALKQEETLKMGASAHFLSEEEIDFLVEEINDI